MCLRQSGEGIFPRNLEADTGEVVCHDIAGLVGVVMLVPCNRSEMPAQRALGRELAYALPLLYAPAAFAANWQAAVSAEEMHVERSGSTRIYTDA